MTTRDKIKQENVMKRYKQIKAHDDLTNQYRAALLYAIKDCKRSELTTLKRLLGHVCKNTKHCKDDCPKVEKPYRKMHDTWRFNDICRDCNVEHYLNLGKRY